MTAELGQWVGAALVGLLIATTLRSVWRALNETGATRARHGAAALGAAIAFAGGRAGLPAALLVGAALLLVAALRLAFAARGWDRRAAIVQTLGSLLLLAGLFLAR
ncbi:hypothetical protein P2H44_05570 [Albimonas sp. CAU 1670]|uniref:hypothetical protein n=1 Tax=Albimonas sp. CAU 1670 TaxID=3032599 RepID=UPI0023DB32BF|nr:hypothetical protein [Albimonas sp. CAU 1670]MDF2232015.1 hypothetical protein [Albimonas sp. CAU 1670]